MVKEDWALGASAWVLMLKPMRGTGEGFKSAGGQRYIRGRRVLAFP